MHLSPGEPEFALRWFLNRLIPDQVENIDVSIYVRKMIDDGRCWNYQHRPREFTVVIGAHLRRRKMLSAIAHEAVHIEQYVTGKLEKIWKKGTKRALWRKRVFEDSLKGRLYDNAPWEKDARAREGKLMHAYLRFLKRSSPLTF